MSADGAAEFPGIEVARSTPSDTELMRSDLVRAEARALGFSAVGIAAPMPSEHVAHLDRWLGRGFHGTMAYLADEGGRARRADLRGTMEAVRSVVVVAHEYYQEDTGGVPDDPAVGVIARYARGADYHRVVKGRLERLLARIRERWGEGGQEGAGEVRGRAYVDTGPILERELARRAGIGWFGRNTMLIHPRRGSYFFLGVLLLDRALAPDPPFVPDRCGRCRACLDACPTGALLGRDEQGAPVMDARRCISYLTIELRGPIPKELRPAIGNRIYGCDICQEVCPFNAFARPAEELRYAARGPGMAPPGVEAAGVEAADVKAAGVDPTHPGTVAPTLVALLAAALDERAWDHLSRGSPLRRVGRAGFARNVCVALGNWGSEEAVPVLRSALADPDPLVRGHAAWGLGCAGTDAARLALQAAFSSESDPYVLEELEGALTSLGGGV